MKTPEELNALKNEFDTVSKKLTELTEEELEQVSGGVMLTLETDNDGVHVITLENDNDGVHVITHETTGKVLEIPGVVKPVTAKPIAYDANQSLPKKWFLSDEDE